MNFNNVLIWLFMFNSVIKTHQDDTIKKRTRLLFALGGKGELLSMEMNLQIINSRAEKNVL
jgi:hypothetical protein